MATATLSSIVESVVPEETVATLIGIKVKTLRNWQSMGRGPTSRRITGRRRIYLAADVYAYLQSLRPDEASTPLQKAVDDEPLRRGRGRPPGSPNRPKPERASVHRRF